MLRAMSHLLQPLQPRTASAQVLVPSQISGYPWSLPRLGVLLQPRLVCFVPFCRLNLQHRLSHQHRALQSPCLFWPPPVADLEPHILPSGWEQGTPHTTVADPICSSSWHHSPCAWLQVSYGPSRVSSTCKSTFCICIENFHYRDAYDSFKLICG